MTIVLGIETTCDETAASVVIDGRKILSNVVYSQIEIHQRFGGVYPEIACRKHLDVLLPIIEKALCDAGLTLEKIDLIAVAGEPGLMGALLMGLNAAKALAYSLNKPFVKVNHIEAHLYAAMMHLETPKLPAIGLVVSGGHTSLVLIEAIGTYTLIGQTVDDAVGEAFDKVARLLELPYPGGPEIEKLAKESTGSSHLFKSGQIKEKPFSFSFSGLKTKLLYAIKGQNGSEPKELTREEKADLAYSFQEAALLDIVNKTLLAANHFGIDTIYIGGGVSNNCRLKDLFLMKKRDSLMLHFPQKGLSLDNAAMIAGLGFHVFQKNEYTSDSLDISASPTKKSSFFTPPLNKCLLF